MARDEQEWESLSRRELIALAREQRAALSTYKETLGRIYQEFDAKIEELSLIRRVSDVLRKAEGLANLGMGLLEVVISESPADFVMLLLADAEMTRLRPVTRCWRPWARAFGPAPASWTSAPASAERSSP